MFVSIPFLVDFIHKNYSFAILLYLKSIFAPYLLIFRPLRNRRIVKLIISIEFSSNELGLSSLASI